jgi:cytoskeletal protein CcmA (bactofilin family)
MIDHSQPDPAEKVSVEPSEQAIRLRSRQIWQREGCPEGHSQDHWARAKAELEAEQEVWMRAKAELDAQMEKTSNPHLPEPIRRKGDFVRSILAQAGAMMPKASWPMARFTDLRAHWEARHDDIDNNPAAFASEDVAPARGSEDSVVSRARALALAAAKRPKQTSVAPSIICADIVLHGSLESTGVIQLDGRVEGNVRSAVLVVSDKGAIQGDVTADDVTVRGSIQGSVRARKIVLGSGARVEGDIIYETFAAEAGARFVGYCLHADDAMAHELTPEEAVEADTPSQEAPRSQNVA